MYRQRILLTFFLLAAVTLPGIAQQHVFRFTAGSDKFLLAGNETELERLRRFVEQNKPQITSGQMPVLVDGYCISFTDRAKNLKTAKVRSNHVKSDMIIKDGLKEEHFTTANHAESYDGEKEVVVVTFRVKEERPEAKAPEQPKVQPEERKPQPQPAAKEEPQKPEPPKNPAGGASQAVMEPAPPAVSDTKANMEWGKFSVRTNLLYWAFATPNLGVEWKPSEKIGILANGLWSHWIWSDRGKHHRTWLVQPELRYYMGGKGGKSSAPAWFLGIEGHTGEFNFKFGDTGYQGDVLGGGLTGGYRLSLSRVFDMDFSLGFGYTNLKYESYYRNNGVSVRKEGGLSKNVFAPTQAGVSLIWKLSEL